MEGREFSEKRCLHHRPLYKEPRGSRLFSDCRSSGLLRCPDSSWLLLGPFWGSPFLASHRPIRKSSIRPVTLAELCQAPSGTIRHKWFSGQDYSPRPASNAAHKKFNRRPVAPTILHSSLSSAYVKGCFSLLVLTCVAGDADGFSSMETARDHRFTGSHCRSWLCRVQSSSHSAIENWTQKVRRLSRSQRSKMRLADLHYRCRFYCGARKISQESIA